MNHREQLFDYILQHGIDAYALKILLRIRREELMHREPFFQCVEISGLGELLASVCECRLVTRRIEERKIITDKSMFCALVFNIVNRLARPLQICTVTHKNCLAVILKGNFEYTPNPFEAMLLKKLQAAVSFLKGQPTSVLVLKLNRATARPSACISVEEMLLNPLSDAYVFLHNV
ncbi:MAG: hypothetical protein IJW78_04320 [Clostridia bacterium]|nr:hypothetical protein [Clostridia bacterium]